MRYILILIILSVVLFPENLFSMETNMLKTADGYQIAFDHYKQGNSSVVILSHGFFNNKDAYLFKSMAEKFSLHFDVISFDYRGHGKSNGLFSWTSNETEDLRTVIAFAKQYGYEKIGVIGFSLGGAIALIEASENGDIDTVISVSAPFDFWKINYRFWEREMFNDLMLNLGPKGKGKGIRPGNPFLPKIKPIDVVDKVSPRPVLFVHGRNDWLIYFEHSEKLFQKAKEPKNIIFVDDAGHAEKIFDEKPDEFMNICTDWFTKTLNHEVKL